MFEEVVNSITHGIGMIAACLGLVVLLYHCIGKTGFHVAASLIYSAALITVYTSSFFLHSLYKVHDSLARAFSPCFLGLAC